MNTQDPTALSFAAYEQMLRATPGFRARAGQRDMAQHIAQCLAPVTLGEHANPTKSIAVVQAGTGVGKSAAYLSTTVSLALLLKTRVIISTATVALQEQLMTKDLPALAAVLDTPFVFALAKGRGRYVCKLKLDRLVGLQAGEGTDDLFDLDEAPLPRHDTPAASGTDPQERRHQLYESLVHALAAQRWDGDRDNLREQPHPSDWATVAAERTTCTARQCPQYGVCSYYNARSLLAQAHVIVANHDLVLATLGRKALPELDNCLVVFDEGHHLPAVALDQFSSSMDMSNLRWLDSLPKILKAVSEKTQTPLDPDSASSAQQLRAGLQDLSRMAIDLAREQAQQTGKADAPYDVVVRFKDGVLAPVLDEPLAVVQGHAQALLNAVESLGAELKRQIKEDPGMTTEYATHYARLGPLAQRLSDIAHTVSLLAEQGEQPLAKWLQSDSASGLVHLSLHASPLMPGELLRHALWGRVRGAVITSATLASCGSFEYFLREAGLDQLAHVSTLEVQSPFNYALQGELVVVHTRADPKHVQAYTAEMVGELLADLAQVRHGALALFTSRVQMRRAVEALPASLQDRVLVQGSASRTRLIAAHQARVESGQPSILFGLQSFGEGLDLPGQLCETVLIAKLPFSAPSDPVDEARAEWLKRMDRDPFSELVVPATGIRLQQWTGRAIRDENDHARVICYDRRLLLTPYGRRMLQGLPRYTLRQRVAGEEQAV